MPRSTARHELGLQGGATRGHGGDLEIRVGAEHETLVERLAMGPGSGFYPAILSFAARVTAPVPLHPPPRS